MTPEIASNAIFTCLCIISLAVLIFWELRSLAADWFRDNLFSVRDSMFDEAAAGLIDFDHPAYGMLRQTMNGYIRFCHRYSLLFALISAWLSYRDENSEALFDKNWTHVTQELSGKPLQRLNVYRNKMELLVISYLIISSPMIAILLFVVLLLGFAVKEIGSLRKKVVLKWAEQLQNSKRFQLILRDMDDTAYASGLL